MQCFIFQEGVLVFPAVIAPYRLFEVTSFRSVQCLSLSLSLTFFELFQVLQHSRSFVERDLLKLDFYFGKKINPTSGLYSLPVVVFISFPTLLRGILEESFLMCLLSRLVSSVLFASTPFIK